MKAAFGFVALLLGFQVAIAADNITAVFQQGLIEEEANRNLTNAIAAYEQVVRHLDDQRRLAATAVFRLGECYRKLGQNPEATAAYQRILREFPDETTLTKLSRENLAAIGLATVGKVVPADPGGTRTVPGTGTAAAARERQRQLLEAELALVQQKVTITKSKHERGVASSEDLIAVQREALVIERQIAALDASVPDLLSLDLTPSTDPTAPGDESADTAVASAPAAATSQEAEELQKIQALIKESPDLINAVADGAAPLHRAAAAGYTAVVEYLIQAKARLDVRGRYEATPLHEAAMYGRRRVVELLADAGADVNAVDSHQASRANAGFTLHGYKPGNLGFGSTPLQLAVSKGFLSVAGLLLERRADVHAKNGFGMTALHIAASQGHEALIQLLLDHGANLQARDLEDHTVLARAVIARQVSAAELLIDRGTDVKVANYRKATALHHAAGLNLVGLIRLLVSKGASVDATDAEGKTPLHWAVNAVAVEAAQALLESKPNLEAKDHSGVTPLYAALCANSPTVALVEVLLKAGASPDCEYVEKGQRYPGLHLNLVQDRLPVALLLLNHGANPNLQNSQLDTPLHLTARSNPKFNLEFMSELLAKKADPNSRNAKGQTPLHAAVSSQTPEAVELLLKHGADPNIRDQTGATPLDLLRPSASGRAQPAGLRPVAPVALPAPVFNTVATYHQAVAPPQGAIAMAGAAVTNAALSQYSSPELASLLLASGAKEYLPDPLGIAVSRPAKGYQQRVLCRTASSPNRFTLLELLAVHYGILRQSDCSPSSGGLPFPDWSFIRIRRMQPDGELRPMAFDVASMLNDEGCGGDVWLEWGDVVEIPEADHPLNAGWELGKDQAFLPKLKRCLERTVHVEVKGDAKPFKLEMPFQAMQGSGWRWHQERYSWDAITTVNRSGLLRTSSDRTNIRVVRLRDPVSGAAGKWEWTVDVTQPATVDSIWLREGDVIQVPDRN